jgi:hypothetical protein
MKNVSTEAIIGSIIIATLVIAAFLWVMFFKPETQEKYNPPYKYYSGDKPDYSRK